MGVLRFRRAFFQVENPEDENSLEIPGTINQHVPHNTYIAKAGVSWGFAKQSSA